MVLNPNAMQTEQSDFVRIQPGAPLSLRPVCSLLKREIAKGALLQTPPIQDCRLVRNQESDQKGDHAFVR